MTMDFNNAESQQYGELIPNGTFCKLVMSLRPGGVGPEGWLTESKSSDAQYLSCEFTVSEGPLVKRKLWANLTWTGGKLNDKKQSMGGEITRSTLRAILESSRGINPSDMGEQASAARRVNSFGEFDGIEFVAKIGIEKGKDGYPDKNKIAMAVTPDKKEYQQVMSGQVIAAPASTSGKPSWAQGAASSPGTPQQPKAGDVAPAWAQGSAPPPAQNPKPVIPAWAK